MKLKGPELQVLILDYLASSGSPSKIASPEQKTLKILLKKVHHIDVPLSLIQKWILMTPIALLSRGQNLTRRDESRDLRWDT